MSVFSAVVIISLFCRCYFLFSNFCFELKRETMTVSENVILILLFLLIFNKYESKFYFHLVVGQTTIIQMLLSTEGNLDFYQFFWSRTQCLGFS